MKTLAPNGVTTLNLPAFSALSITVSGSGSGSIERLGNNPGDASLGTTAISAATTVGPFAFTTRHALRSNLATLSYDIAAVDFPAVTPAIERIVKLSQADYDALSPADPATLYLIVG